MFPNQSGSLPVGRGHRRPKSLASLLLAAALLSCSGDPAPVDACEPSACAVSPCEQVELTSRAPVLADDGSLATIAWARRPIFEYDPSKIPESLAEQVKDWDFYSVQSPDWYAEVTIARLSWFSFIGVTLLNYETGDKYSGWDLGDDTNPILPDSPYADAGWNQGDNHISISFADGARILAFDIPGKFGDVDLKGEIVFGDGPGFESLSVAHPLLDPGTFFYEDKIFGWRTSGWVTAGDVRADFSRDDAWGVLDWGRGAWPHESQWFWGAGYGVIDGHDVAFNMGAGLDANQQASADGILVDGVIHKLGAFDGMTWEMDPDDPLKPWVIQSPDGRMDLTLTPHTHVPTELDIGGYYMHGTKVYGMYNGTLVLDDCTVLQVRDIPGFAEKSLQRW